MTIDIKAQLGLLRELQSVDIHMREIEEELSNIPDLIEESQERLLEASTSLKEKEGKKAESEKKRRELESELQCNEEHLRGREARLYSIKTNKEYQAAIKEIADGKRANKEREDAILRLMEKIDALSQEITQLSGKAAEEEREFRKEEEEFVAKKRELEKERDARKGALEKFEKQLDKTVLEKYNFIRSRYLDPLAAVRKGICQGCNMNVPPQMFIELLKGRQFHFCPNCHRFIYVYEGSGEEDEKSELKESNNEV